jgi:NAD(P)-dependent dehydrogenase (short-subunit alcohol dehydrogenase family)
MSEKIVIITGANSGIGKDAALRFAKEGFTVVMACRSLEKSKPVKNEIMTSSQNENVFLKEVDIASFSSIQAFCNDFKKSFPKLDILIHNAAYFNHGENYRLTEDNIEITFATNVVGPFLMTQLLLEHLKKSDNAKVLNASSNIIKHYFSPKKEITFENLQGISNRKYKHSVYKSYRNSKIAFLMLTFKMADEYKHFGVNVNSLQINGAKMSKETLNKFKFWWKFIAIIQNLFFPLPEFMANNYYEICTSEKFRNITGKYFNNKLEIMEPGTENPKIKDIIGTHYYPRYANRTDIQEKIWNLCTSLTGNYF